MGYFDGLTEASFKKDSQGQTLFFPWGVIGKGYIVTDSQKEAQLRKFTKLNYMITLPIVVFNQVVFGYLPNLVLLPIYFITFIVLLKKFTRDLPSTNDKLKISEAYKNSAKKHSLFTLIVLAISALIFTAVGLIFILEGSLLLGAFAFVLFGFTAASLSFMAWNKVKK